MKLTSDQRYLLEQFCNENDYELRESYSGRGMYGTDCVGIVTSNVSNILASLILFAFDKDGECGLEDNRKLFNKMMNSSQDSMGLDQILYFPGVQWDDESAEE